jgi:hypothetical protein
MICICSVALLSLCAAEAHADAATLIVNSGEPSDADPPPTPVLQAKVVDSLPQQGLSAGGDITLFTAPDQPNEETDTTSSMTKSVRRSEIFYRRGFSEVVPLTWNKKIRCTASLIGSDLIVTSAHCVTKPVVPGSLKLAPIAASELHVAFPFVEGDFCYEVRTFNGPTSSVCRYGIPADKVHVPSAYLDEQGSQAMDVALITLANEAPPGVRTASLSLKFGQFDSIDEPGGLLRMPCR